MIALSLPGGVDRDDGTDAAQILPLQLVNPGQEEV